MQTETIRSMPSGRANGRLASALGKSRLVQLDGAYYRLSTFVYMNVFTNELRPSVPESAKGFDLG